MPNPLVFLKAKVVQDKLSQITQADLTVLKTMKSDCITYFNIGHCKYLNVITFGRHIFEHINRITT